MIPIHFPEPSFRIRQEGETSFLFDNIRKKWMIITPEEWVRQNFIQYLVSVLHYPVSLIALEKKLQLGELTKRFDILVYDKTHRPWMIVECKAPGIFLSEDVLHQVLRYNLGIPVPYLVITNGNTTYAWKKDNNLVLLDQLPVHE
jgi:hypothetical protein